MLMCDSAYSYHITVLLTSRACCRERLEAARQECAAAASSQPRSCLLGAQPAQPMSRSPTAAQLHRSRAAAWSEIDEVPAATAWSEPPGDFTLRAYASDEEAEREAAAEGEEDFAFPIDTQGATGLQLGIT